MVLIGVWQSSILSAVEWVNAFGLSDNVVQFVPDADMRPRSLWVVCRVTDGQAASLRSTGAKATPKWTFLDP